MKGTGTSHLDMQDDCQDVVNAVYNPRITFDEKIKIITDVGVKTRDILLSEFAMDAIAELKDLKDPGYLDNNLRSRELPTYMYQGDTKTRVLNLVQYAMFSLARNQMPVGNNGEARRKLERELDGFKNSSTHAMYMLGLDVSSEAFGYTYIASSKNVVMLMPKNYFALAGFEVGKPIEFSIQGDSIQIRKYKKCCVVCGSVENVNKRIRGEKYICDECIKKIN